MTPDGCSSLYGEFAYIGKSKHTVQRMLHDALTQIKKLLNIAKHDIITEKIMYITHAYVIYNFWREKNLTRLLARLEACNIYSTGRYGAWKYSSMQEAVLDGKKVAETITIQPAIRAFDKNLSLVTPTKRKQVQ